jgi:hypothetical protein
MDPFLKIQQFLSLSRDARILWSQKVHFHVHKTLFWARWIQCALFQPYVFTWLCYLLGLVWLFYQCWASKLCGHVKFKHSNIVVWEAVAKGGEKGEMTANWLLKTFWGSVFDWCDGKWQTFVLKLQTGWCAWTGWWGTLDTWVTVSTINWTVRNIRIHFQCKLHVWFQELVQYL